MASMAIVHTAQDHFEKSREYQEKFDAALRECGMRAPMSVLGQPLNDYHRYVLGLIQERLMPEGHELRKLDVNTLRNDKNGRVLDNFEDQIIKAGVEGYNDPRSVPLGTIRKVEKLDPLGNVRRTDFIGQESFVKQMTIPGRRVKSISKPYQEIAVYHGNERMQEVDNSGRPR
jgi:hypothetical protein